MKIILKCKSIKFFKFFYSVLTIIFLSAAFFTPAFLSLRAAAAAEKSVIATFYPLYVHALNICGDKIKVEVLLPPGVGIHDFNCKPSDIKKIAGASLMIINGASLDDFALKIAKNYTDLKIADASYGVELITSDGAACEHGGHDHSQHHEHAPKAGGELYDPHTWLSMKNAVIQVNNILRALCEIDPENAEYYKQNAAEYIIKIEYTHKKTAEKLSPFKGSKFIIFHGSFAYFARDYGLTQDSIADVFGNAPKPSKIKEIYDTIKKENIKFLVSEPGYQNKEIKALSEQYSLEVIELDPMDLYKPSGDIKNYYIETADKNVNSLASAFNKAAINK
jgi:ABC-type Zn uptake system ZnuABC Zn-binding protein ZnuA